MRRKSASAAAPRPQFFLRGIVIMISPHSYPVRPVCGGKIAVATLLFLRGCTRH
jgi:hypothetical protein